MSQPSAKEIAEKIAKLKEENAQLSKYCGEVRYWQNRAEDLSEEKEKLKEQNSGLIEALRFYAEERNWTDGMNYWEEFQLTPCGDDFGKKANSALKKWGGV